MSTEEAERKRRRWWLRLLLMSLALNMAALAGVVALVASPSAAGWLAPRLHLATHADVRTAERDASDAEALTDELSSRVDDLEGGLSTGDLQEQLPVSFVAAVLRAMNEKGGEYAQRRCLTT